MISYKDIRRVRFGGTFDTFALLWAMAAGFLTLPMLYGVTKTGWILAATVAAFGGLRLGWRVGEKIRLKSRKGMAGLEINSAIEPEHDPDGVRLGFIDESMRELSIPLADLLGHAMIVGQSGVGKTVMGEWLMFQQIARGGGLLWIDGKLDPDNLAKLHQMCAWCGRADDLLVVNPGDPSMSNTYNPLLDGDADEIASRCVSLIPTAESNAGADYYRQSATIAINTLVTAIRTAGYAFDFADLRALLTRPNALKWLGAELKRQGHDDEAVQFDLFLDQFRSVDRKTGAQVLDADGLRRTFGGLGSRLAQFGAGQFGKVMNTYAPDVRIKDVVRQGKIVYFMLPTMAKSEAATALAKMAIANFRSAVAAIQALPVAERPKRPFLGFFDEAGSYVTQAWARMFEQARSARIVMIPAFQTRANLEVLGEELRAMVAGNTLTKIFFKPGEPDTAQWIAEMIGKEMRVQRSATESTTQSRRSANLTDRMGRGATDAASGGRSTSESTTVREDYKVTPADLLRLEKGECIVTWRGHSVYHVQVPRVTFDDAFVARAGRFRVRRHAGDAAPAEGLSITKRPAAMR